jgi:Eukaryotic aspartyl protease
VNVTVGTPPQKVQLLLDTGTSDTWFNAQSSDECTETTLCDPYGSYSANSSSTYSYIPGGFNSTQAGLFTILGDYASDTLTVGNNSFQSLQIGIAYNSTVTTGSLGIGYPTGESQVAYYGGQVYKNLPLQMVAEGLINSNAYSLWLNDVNASTGTILFGGVDTAKYHPPLMTFPLQQIGGSVSQLPITLTDVSFGSTTIEKNMALALGLVSGDTLTYLPNSLAQAIFQEVGAFFDKTSGQAFLPCSSATNPGTLNFTFSSVTIAIPMRELVLNEFSTGPPVVIGGQNVPACLFGIAPNLGTPMQLGASFMRSVYLVFDMDNNEVSIAPTNFDSTDSNVVEIGKGKGAVPNATPVANVVVATSGTSSYVFATPTLAVGLGGGNTTTSGVERTTSVRSLGAAVILGWSLFCAWM